MKILVSINLVLWSFVVTLMKVKKNGASSFITQIMVEPNYFAP